MTTLGVLHPGSMGAAVAEQAASTGTTVLWCGAGRSPATRKRAEESGLTETGSLDELVARSDVIMSLCPPANAEQLASEVADLGFVGVYVEANAIAPTRVLRIEALLRRAVFVDGAVVGSPPRRGKTTRLYLAGGEGAMRTAADLFAGTSVDTRLLSGGTGQASALKLSYSSYQKASRVLAAVAHGLAAEHGVQEELLDIAALRTTNYLSELDYVPKTAARAWRWAPEMQEAADALLAAGLPSELADAAAATMLRWQQSKNANLTVGDALTQLGNRHTDRSG